MVSKVEEDARADSLLYGKTLTPLALPKAKASDFPQDLPRESGSRCQ